MALLYQELTGTIIGAAMEFHRTLKPDRSVLSSQAAEFAEFTLEQKRKMGQMDSRIAAIAISVNGIVVTLNIKDFIVSDLSKRVGFPILLSPIFSPVLKSSFPEL